MISAFVPLVGALISVMSGVNSRLAARVGILAATLVIHLAGLAGISLVLAMKREKRGSTGLPLYYYLGGFVGVGTVFSTIYAFGTLGAALAVALALLGQAIFSAVVDATGLFGRTRYPLSLRALPGLLLAAAGVTVMVVGGADGVPRASLPAMVIAFVAGALPGLSFILNSELGRAIGVFRSTRVNYIVGLATTVGVILVAWAFSTAPMDVPRVARAILAAGPILVLGGGLMGVVVVTSINLVFPRVPALFATLLLFAGQASAGIIIDLTAQGMLDAKKLIGTLVLMAGLIVNRLLTRRPTADRGP